MSEKPILFSGEMVRATLDGRQTQTRRVVKTRTDNATRIGSVGHQAHIDSPEALAHCPYGQPGDFLWVRETWNIRDVIYDDYHGGFESGYPYDSIPKNKPSSCFLEYSADDATEGPWRPSIHMPRWASRITLEITGVRVERLQDISEDDAREEGVSAIPYLLDADNNELPAMSESMSKMRFRKLWDRINSKRGYGWEANPWVWAINFKRV